MILAEPESEDPQEETGTWEVHSYSYDPVGNRTEFCDGTSTTEYTFNELDQLISSVVTTEDNQTTSSRTYSYDRIIDQSGVAVATYHYDEYGNIISQTRNDIDNEICYTGQIYDESTGLYYYNARFYDPEDGIFTTQDTDRGQAAEPSTLNYYACIYAPL